MATIFHTAQFLETGIVSARPIRIYTGILGQIGDIIMFTATARRLRELFPQSQITFAVSSRYQEAGELVAGLPYINRLFVTALYFERMSETLFHPWHLGWPADLRGDDEVAEQRQHDIVLETRPRHRRMPWWEFDHQVAKLRTWWVCRVPSTCGPKSPSRPGRRSRPVSQAGSSCTTIPRSIPRRLGRGPACDGSLQRCPRSKSCCWGIRVPTPRGRSICAGRTTLAQAAAIIRTARCYVGIDSGLMWIAGSLEKPAVGLYGTSYIPAYQAIQPRNPQAIYLQADGTLDRIAPETVLAAVRRFL